MDGIILVGSNFIYEKEEDNKYIPDACRTGSCDAVECSHGCSNVYSIVSDDFTSMYDATMEMIRSGVEDILYFYNSTSYSGKKSWPVTVPPWKKKDFSPTELPAALSGIP